MIKSTFKFIWEVLIEMGEARHARYKRNGYAMWY